VAGSSSGGHARRVSCRQVRHGMKACMLCCLRLQLPCCAQHGSCGWQQQWWACSQGQQQTGEAWNESMHAVLLSSAALLCTAWQLWLAAAVVGMLAGSAADR
jgi:hypothetical protein